MKLSIIETRRVWLALSGGMVVAACVALAFWQLRFGVDFTGGSLLEVVYATARPSSEAVQNHLSLLGIEGEVRGVGEKGMLVRMKTINEETHQNILAQLKKDDAGLVERSFESIGPVIGAELRNKSVFAIILALALILIYISIVFRKVSYPVASWKYGVAAVLALFHDLLFIVGIFAVLGRLWHVEITSSFIPAFLTVLGFSVHDTIVVFDRIRENLLKYKGSFEEVVSKSLNETLARSINTSLTVLLVLAALLAFGGATLWSFSLALFLGIAVGTYSSLFVASPLLVEWYRFSLNRKK